MPNAPELKRLQAGLLWRGYFPGSKRVYELLAKNGYREQGTTTDSVHQRTVKEAGHPSVEPISTLQMIYGRALLVQKSTEDSK